MSHNVTAPITLPPVIQITAPLTFGYQGPPGEDGADGLPGTTTWAGITDKPATFTPDLTAHLAAADPHGDRAYADALVIGLVDDRGNFDASVNTYPTTGGSGTAGAILKGDIWTISVVASSGPLAGFQVGCLIRALIDTPGQTAANWVVTAVGFGYTPENSANKSADVATDQASTSKYPTVKALYDWAVGLFATITGIQTLTNKTLTNPTVTNFTESPLSIGNSGTSQTLSLTNGTFQTVTLTGNCTFTMPSASGGKSFTLLANTGSGGFTATFTGVKWTGGVTPVITTTASSLDIFSFISDGTNWYGSYIQNFTP